MRVIWKRPDGFLGASPEDFKVVELAGHSRIWLHKRDCDHYPFQVAGDWEELEGTVQLNNLVNLLVEPLEAWIKYLGASFSHSLKDDKNEYCANLTSWLQGLSQNLKGDTWEVDILKQALSLTQAKLAEATKHFLKN